jgi:F0F1-type ATP synthase delta subunit
MTEITDNSKNFDNLKEKNQQVLNNISQLQEQEQKLYDSLSNENISPEEKKQIINQ